MAPIALHVEEPVHRPVKVSTAEFAPLSTARGSNNASSGRPKVFTLEPLHSRALALAREKFDLVLPGDSDFSQWPTQAEGLLARNAIVSAENTRILKENKIRYIAKQGVGVDNFDLAALRDCEIPLMNTPGVNATAVAELALGLIIDVARGVPTIDRRIRAGDRVTKLDGWKGKTLQGTTLGLIGGGNIGLCLGRMYSLAFRSNLLVYDPYISDHGKAQWEKDVPSGQVTFVSSLGDLLIDSDVVSIHVPLTSGTKDLIAAPQLRQMKETAILVNTARGGIVNEDDLADALERGVIFGAALDAFVFEPPTSERYERFCRLPNLVMSPHIGAATEAAQEETCLSMVQHLVEAFEGKELRDRVC